MPRRTERLFPPAPLARPSTEKRAPPPTRWHAGTLARWHINTDRRSSYPVALNISIQHHWVQLPRTQPSMTMASSQLGSYGTSFSFSTFSMMIFSVNIP